MFDTSQAGYYRSERTKRIVFVEHIRHFKDGTGRIEASFRGTRDGKPFGRTFGKPIEDFFATYEFISKDAVG